MKIRKSKSIVFILAVLMAVSLLPAFAVNAKAQTEDEVILSEKIQEPLDFSTDTSTRSGDGWSWDQATATLTLNSLNLDLTQYTDAYKAAIMLPAVNDGVTLVLNNNSYIDLSGADENGEGRLGIYALGDLKIIGEKGLLGITAAEGANGIEADGKLTVGSGGDPDNGPKLEISAMDFALGTSQNLVLDGAKADFLIAGTNETPNAPKFAMVAENQIGDEGGIKIQNSQVAVTAGGKGVVGMIAYDKKIYIVQSTYEQNALPFAEDVSGIVAFNGGVDIVESSLNMKLNEGDTSATGGVIVANSFPQAEQPADKPGIILLESSITASGATDGLTAEYGKVDIAGSSADVTVIGHAVNAGSSGVTILRCPQLNLKNTGNYYSSAVRSFGEVSIMDSSAYITGKGEEANGMTVNEGAKLIIDGKNTVVDLEGTRAALMMNDSEPQDPAVPPLILDKSLAAEIGGTFQHVDYQQTGSLERTFSFSESTLSVDEQGLVQNASTHVLIGNPGGLKITKQPADAVVSYPEGATFEVEVLHPENVDTYQWFLTDCKGNEFELTGTSAKTNKLTVPSTLQMDDILTYHCKIKDKDGNEIVSRKATLDLDNREEDKTVLYIGCYAIEPGESLDLSMTELGRGKVTFDEDGTDITLENVFVDNDNMIYDLDNAPALGFCLIRCNNQEEDYYINLVGENSFVNHLYQPEQNTAGIPFDFYLYGEETVRPRVVFDGTPSDPDDPEGTLSVTGGTNAIRIMGEVIANADIRIDCIGDIFEDGIVCDALTVISDKTLDLEVNGAGISVTGGLTIEEAAEVVIDTVAPRVSADSTYKGAIFVGGGLMEMKDGSKLVISGHATPNNGAEIGGFAGIMLENDAHFEAEGSSIDIRMGAEEDPGSGDYHYAANFMGITGNDMTLKNTDVKVNIDSEAIFNASGIRAFDDVALTNCDIQVTAKASGMVYGLAAEGDLTTTATSMDITTGYYGTDGTSMALAGNKLDLAIENPDYHITADATNEDGIAIAAKTGETGDTPKGYDESYEAKNLLVSGMGDCLEPEQNKISLSSIAGSLNPYVYIETYYDTTDTSKPANKVELAVKELPIAAQPEDAHVNYPAATSFTVEAANPDNVASYQWELYDGVQSWILDGTSATTNKLILPSTRQVVGDICQYRCLITGKDGSASYSDYASLIIDNKDENKMVFYVGEHAVEPGGSLNLSDTDNGSGIVTYAADGKTVTLSHVQFNNEKVVYDSTDAPAIGMELYGYGREEEEFKVRLEGQNSITNTFYQADQDLAGIAFNIAVYGPDDPDTGFIEHFPKVTFEGDLSAADANLTMQGGTYAIHSAGPVDIKAKIMTVPDKDHTAGGIYLENGALTILEGSNVFLDTNGQAIFIGSDEEAFLDQMNLEIKDGASLICTCDIPAPLPLKDGSYNSVSLNGVFVHNDIIVSGKAIYNVMLSPTMERVNSKNTGIDSVEGMIADNMIRFENSSVDVVFYPVGTEGDIEEFTGIGANIVDIDGADVSVEAAQDSCAKGEGIAGMEAVNIYNNSDVKVDVAANGDVFGIETPDQLVLSDSNLDVKTKSDYGNEQIALACGTLQANITDSKYSVRAATDGGYAICALIDDSEKPMNYKAGYRPVQISLEELTVITTPNYGEISTFGMTNPQGPGYLNVETVYDPADTTKPAAALVLEKGTDISGAKVTLAKTQETYSGKALKPAVKSVVLGGVTLTAGKDYAVSYQNNINAGKATVTVTGKGKYVNKVSTVFTIAKAKQPMKVSAKKKTVKSSKLQKKNQTVKAVKVKKNQGKLNFKKKKVNNKQLAKNFKVNKKNGKITVKKGTPKGTYKITVKVTAAGNRNYKKGSVTKKVTINVK